VEKALRLIQETGADAVKAEGAQDAVREITERLVLNGVNVVAHIGLQPQMVSVTGGYKIQGKSAADILLKEAITLEKSGARLIVLEGMDSTVAEQITANVSTPTIGIGAGGGCDGQVLVFHDLFGYAADDFKPKFVKRYAEVGKIISEAAKAFINDVKTRAFPDGDHSYKKG
jgi:3-methyl-2-oxobutanoate hydroxymethyltransferase